MLEQDTYFMERALHQVELALAQGQAPFGAVVVGADGKLLGEGYNTTRADFDPSAHGEIVAIRHACRQAQSLSMENCTLYTSCEPCLLCSFVITQIGFRRVVFAARAHDVKGYSSLLAADFTQAAEWVNQQPDWSKIEVVGDFMRESSVELLNQYFK